MSSPAHVSASTSGVLGAAALATDYADDLLLGTVRDVHSAVSRRVRSATRPLTGASRDARTVGDHVSAAVYGGIGAGLRAAGSALRAGERRGIGPRMEDSPTGQLLTSAVNALIGDRLARERPEMAIALSVRVRGRDLPARPEDLAREFADTRGDLVLFVHGLGENDGHWARRGEGAPPSYGDRLRREAGWSPVVVRVNTGLPVGENGAALAGLLDDLVAHWPVPVRRIALVGHSMGGLIIRSACAVVTESANPWNLLVTDVVTLGTPHLGAPLERAVSVGARALGVLPESAPFGRILDYRSRGILDLRQGLAADVANLPHARYHLVAATLASSHRHPLSEALGDLLVRYPSATGQGRRRPPMFPDADVLHVRGDHFDLLNHPEVHRALADWLS